jgi:hypothetical protein
MFLICSRDTSLLDTEFEELVCKKFISFFSTHLGWRFHAIFRGAVSLLGPFI